MTVKVSRKGSMIVLGNDEARVEEGPVLKTATATAELLHDDNSAKHYYAGVRPMPFNDALGKPYEVPSIGRDALGKPIKIGEKMSYLDHGGDKAMGERCFYLYRKVKIDPTAPTLENGDENPHFVPEHIRDGALLLDDDTPANVTHYTYKFEEIGTFSTEESAMAAGKELLGEKG